MPRKLTAADYLRVLEGEGELPVALDEGVAEDVLGVPRGDPMAGFGPLRAPLPPLVPNAPLLRPAPDAEWDWTQPRPALDYSRVAGDEETPTPALAVRPTSPRLDDGELLDVARGSDIRTRQLTALGQAGADVARALTRTGRAQDFEPPPGLEGREAARIAADRMADMRAASLPLGLAGLAVRQQNADTFRGNAEAQQRQAEERLRLQRERQAQGKRPAAGPAGPARLPIPNWERDPAMIPDPVQERKAEEFYRANLSVQGKLQAFARAIADAQASGVNRLSPATFKALSQYGELIGNDIRVITGLGAPTGADLQLLQRMIGDPNALTELVFGANRGMVERLAASLDNDTRNALFAAGLRPVAETDERYRPLPEQRWPQPPPAPAPAPTRPSRLQRQVEAATGKTPPAGDKPADPAKVRDALERARKLLEKKGGGR